MQYCHRLQCIYDTQNLIIPEGLKTSYSITGTQHGKCTHHCNNTAEQLYTCTYRILLNDEFLVAIPNQ